MWYIKIREGPQQPEGQTNVLVELKILKGHLDVPLNCPVLLEGIIQHPSVYNQ